MRKKISIFIFLENKKRNKKDKNEKLIKITTTFLFFIKIFHIAYYIIYLFFRLTIFGQNFLILKIDDFSFK